jgi:hypothetical protein
MLEAWRYEGAAISNKIFKSGRSRYKESGVGSLKGVLKSYTERPNVKLTR